MQRLIWDGSNNAGPVQLLAAQPGKISDHGAEISEEGDDHSSI